MKKITIFDRFFNPKKALSEIKDKYIVYKTAILCRNILAISFIFPTLFAITSIIGMIFTQSIAALPTVLMVLIISIIVLSPLMISCYKHHTLINELKKC